MIDYNILSPDATLTLKGQSLGSTPKYHPTKNKNVTVSFRFIRWNQMNNDEYVWICSKYHPINCSDSFAWFLQTWCLALLQMWRLPEIAPWTNPRPCPAETPRFFNKNTASLDWRYWRRDKCRSGCISKRRSTDSVKLFIFPVRVSRSSAVPSMASTSSARFAQSCLNWVVWFSTFLAESPIAAITWENVPSCVFCTCETSCLVFSTVSRIWARWLWQRAHSFSSSVCVTFKGLLASMASSRALFIFLKYLRMKSNKKTTPQAKRINIHSGSLKGRYPGSPLGHCASTIANPMWKLRNCLKPRRP